MKISLVALMLATPVSLGVALADVEAGRDAANRGDYSKAIAEWKPLAQAGDSEAQYLMGRLYANGDGVSRNYKEAFRWFEKAGRQGHKKAQGALSKMYKYGDGVKANAKLSDQWKSGFIPAESSELLSEPEIQKEKVAATPIPTREAPPTSTPEKSVEIPPNKEFPRSDKFSLSEFPIATPTPTSSLSPKSSDSKFEPAPSPVPTEGADSAFPNEEGNSFPSSTSKKSFDYERPTPESNRTTETIPSLPTKMPGQIAPPSPKTAPAPKSDGVGLDDVL